MDLQKVEQIALKTMSRRKSHLQRERGFIYYHCSRVASMSLQLRKRLFPERTGHDDCIYAGALFHDVTKGIEPHHETGAHMVRQLLKEACSESELELVSEIVFLHNRRKVEDQPYYAKIVQDADILDHFGSLNIWLKFQYSAAQEENVFDAIQLWESDEHKHYIEESRDALNFELSRQLFDQKIEFEKRFQTRFTLECNGEIDF